MAFERLRNAALPQAALEAWSDVGQLLQNEACLAKAEISTKLQRKLKGSVWLGLAGVLVLLALIFGGLAFAFAIASYDIPMHWAFSIVTILFVAGAAASYLTGRESAQEDLTPTRTLHQIRQDIATVKESFR